MDKIRIAYIIDQFGVGGTEGQLSLLIASLDRKRFKPSIFILRGDKNHPLIPDNTPVYLLNIHRLLSIDGLKKMYQVIQLLRYEKIQIVQTFFQDSTVVGVLAGKIARVQQIVVCIRDMLFWASPFVLFIQKVMMKMSNLILVNSISVKETVEPLLRNGRVKVIYNGIYIGEEFSKNDKAKNELIKEFNFTDYPIVVLVSNCNRPVKRIDLLIESIPLVVARIPAYFLIVGDGWMRSNLEKRVTELNIGKFVRFAGSRNDVNRILAGSDIALNTSDSEGLSNSVMEAMRAGLAVIASNVGGNKELVKNNVNGLLFTPGNKDDLKEKLLYLLKDMKIAEQFGKNGKHTIEQYFDIKLIVHQYNILYTSIAGK
ncbi:hypothetical protein DSCW_03860 [Desulfosarcina widdelii]|uniref:Uncharacterized protein n=1 Tax=Desulfosarcina widdelii TaxID=947919 RepID=A0A5K7YY65_9BACT|nr:glycosyltransferase [Desulfosarcina widdelii]BBO72969.1 hypothetical protein DSCW_03860 [Desulfosarcina widdelii]